MAGHLKNAMSHTDVGHLPGFIYGMEISRVVLSVFQHWFKNEIHNAKERCRIIAWIEIAKLEKTTGHGFFITS